MQILTKLLSLKRALVVLGSLFLGLLTPQSFAANCPSGATMIRGKCTCPTGKVPSLDGRRCVAPPKTTEKERTKTKAEPKVKGEPAKGSSIPSGAKIRILSLTKEDPFYDIRNQLIGKEGVVYPDPMSKILSAPKTDAGIYQGTISIDGIDWYFYQVSISILDFGVTPTKKTAAYGDFVPEGSILTIKEVLPADLTYYKTKIKKLKGQKCTVGAAGLVPNGGAYYSGEVTCTDGNLYYFLGFTFNLDKAAASVATAAACDPSAYINSAVPIIAGQRVKVLGFSSLDPLYADRASIIGKEGYVTSTMALFNGCYWEGKFTADDGTFYSFYEAQLKDLGKSTSSACLASAATVKSLLGGQKVKILEVGPGDATYVDREKWKGKTGLVSGDLFNTGGCWFDGGVTVEGGAYTYFSQIQVQELSPPPPTPTCAADASTVASFVEGTKVTVVEIAPIDLYYGERTKWLGQSGKVTLSLLNGGGCWYGGEITFDNGEVRYFASIQVKESSASTGSGGNLSKLNAYTGASLALGTSVTILDVSSSDIFYGSRSSIIGKACKVGDGPLLSAGSGWFSGQLYCVDGTSYSFAQVSVMLVTKEAKLPAKVTKYTGKSVKKGTALQIIEIGSDDIFFGQRDTIVGKSGCSASEALSSSEAGWFTGGISCTDGSSYSFFKVSIGLSK
jgi:hypothetical protein